MSIEEMIAAGIFALAIVVFFAWVAGLALRR